MKINELLKILKVYGKTTLGEVSINALSIAIVTSDSETVIALADPISRDSGNARVDLFTFREAIQRLNAAKETVLRLDIQEKSCKINGISTSTLSRPRETQPKKYDESHTLRIDMDAIRAVEGYRSDDPTHESMHGIHIDTDGSVIATDGRRLKMVQCAPTQAPPTTIPRLVVDILCTIKESQKINIYTQNRIIEHSITAVVMHGAGSISVSQRHSSRPFPPWRLVVPNQENTIELRDCKAIAKSIKNAAKKYGASTVRMQGNCAQFVEFIADDDAASRSDLVKVTQESIPLQWPIESAFNPAYLCDALSESDTVTVSQHDNLAPCRIDYDQTTIVVMPMRV